MKYIIFTIALCSIISLSAQTLSYTDDYITYDDQHIQTVAATLEPDVSTIKDKFEDWMNDNYNVDLDGKKLLFFNKDVMTAENVVIPQVSDYMIQLNVKVDETHKGKTRLYVFAKKMNGVYISQSTDEQAFSGLKGIVHEFIADYLPEYYMEQIEDTKDDLGNLNDDINDMEDKIKKNEEKIIDIKKENKELREKIDSKNRDIKKTESELKTDKKEFKTIKKKVNKNSKK